MDEELWATAVIAGTLSELEALAERAGIEIKEITEARKEAYKRLLRRLVQGKQTT